MNTHFHYRIVGALLLSFLMFNCQSDRGTAEDVREETEEAVHATGRYLERQREQFVTQAKQQLRDLEMQNQDLREEAGNTGKQVKEEWNRQMMQLETQAAELRRELNEAGDMTEDAWTDFTARVQRELAEVRKGFNELSEKLKSGSS
jgi:hypothetical protein